ncbi:hypothetical protein [Aquimarina sp. 2201CG14-23]|uniref:hypothetical protein n=1 Tax=Aquimarina mycalae TaxID=3040073 RepID=UPI00247814D8|nr:hypothetical protein [Aquimarina sp. 2201CG14-23]MDH7445080.1 hypothetical protein [Aquimarina sp. 2201CG14-23]
MISITGLGAGQNIQNPLVDQFLERLTRTTNGVVTFYILNNLLRYAARPNSVPKMTNFIRGIMQFIDTPVRVSMRFVNRTPIIIDSFSSGAVDIDDMLNASDHSFQLSLMHLLTERFATMGYVLLGPQQRRRVYARSHNLALDSDVQLLSNWLNDPTIRFNFQMNGANREIMLFFSSQNPRYLSIRHSFFETLGRDRTTSDVLIELNDGRLISLANFLRMNPSSIPALP